MRRYLVDLTSVAASLLNFIIVLNLLILKPKTLWRIFYIEFRHKIKYTYSHAHNVFIKSIKIYSVDFLLDQSNIYHHLKSP